jgi:hypothetical protein
MSIAVEPAPAASRERAAPQAAAADPMVLHFWKVFAIAVFGVAVWAAYQFDIFGKTHHLQVTTATGGRPIGEQAELLLWDATLGNGEQIKPAVVTLKDGNSQVQGYFQRSDEQFLLLGTTIKPSGPVETVLIPWSNILHVRLTTQPKDAQVKNGSGR